MCISYNQIEYIGKVLRGGALQMAGLTDSAGITLENPASAGFVLSGYLPGLCAISYLTSSITSRIVPRHFAAAGPAIFSAGSALAK